MKPQDVPQRFAAAREAMIGNYGRKPTVVGFAPGRTELIGNHTDYNGGYVLLGALELGTWMAAAPRSDDICRIQSRVVAEEYQFLLRKSGRAEGPIWSRYVEGVLRELQEEGIEVPAFDGVIDGDLPLGCGLSSSASLEVAVAKALLEMAGQSLNDWTLAKVCQRAEHRHPGVPCGLLDQTGAVFGKPDTLLLLDCASLQLEEMPLGRDDLALVFIDSRSKHALVDGDYRARRAECEDATAQLTGLLHRELEWMRDVAPEEFEQVRNQIAGPAADRAAHVFAENQRCLEARDWIRRHRFEDFGRLITASHHSSRALFENSTPALDALVELAAAHKACLGAKLCGGGFGGCTVNLVYTGAVDDFMNSVLESFESRTGVQTRAFAAKIGGGAFALEW